MPVVGVDTSMELSTPTGVAILTALADSFGALPAMTVEAAGYGAGHADPPGRPNVVQVLVGTPAAASATPRPGRSAVALEVNVDDVTGEVLAHTVAALLAAGAHDAWATPIVMKKGRPAHTVAALADPADAERLAALMLAETGSLGLRATTVERWPQRRADTTIELDGQLIRVKVADGRAKPEHDDAVAAARALGRPLRDVLREAETRAHAAAGRALASRLVGAIQVSHVGWRLPGGRDLLRDVSFSVGDGERVALVGANGVGKSTLLRLIARELTPTSGTLAVDGRVGVMRQLVGSRAGMDGAPSTVRELLVSLASPDLRAAAVAPRHRRAAGAGRPDPVRHRARRLG